MIKMVESDKKDIWKEFSEKGKQDSEITLNLEDLLIIQDLNFAALREILYFKKWTTYKK